MLSNLKIAMTVAFAISVCVLMAQKAQIKFGKVSMEEMQMTSCAIDTSAPAVVLCDYGYWNLSDYKFTRTRRVKILKVEGLKYGDLIYPSDESTAIKGKTFNLENGVIVEEKLKNESIFKERIYDDYYRFRIAMPNVKVGSVIDIEISHFGIPPFWEFQQYIPVLWSELIIPESMYIDYRKNFFGYVSLHYTSSNHWIGKNMPAFKPELFTDSPDNYITKIEFDVLSYHFPGFYREMTTDWNAVARRLEESSYFGGVLNAALYLGATANEIKAGDSTKFGQMKLAFEQAKKIKWNEQESFIASNTMLSTVYKEQLGNSADINLILVNLLRKLDIQAHPVVLSTRDNGKLPAYSPSLNKLNYLIAWAKIDDKEYLLDATDEFATIEILPFRCLNVKGQIMRKDVSAPVSLAANKKEIVIEMYELEADEDFILKGKAASSYKEYGAHNFRSYYKTFNSQDDFIEDQEESYPGISISEYELKNLNSLDLPVQENYQIEIKNQMYPIDDKVYINPLIHLKTTDNPFKLEERQYPVNFGYCKEKNYIVKIKVPEGYQVVETPSPMIIELPEKSGRIVYQIANISNTINVTFKLSINKSEYLSSDYKYLREFYNQLIKKQSEPIILQKI